MATASAAVALFGVLSGCSDDGADPVADPPPTGPPSTTASPMPPTTLATPTLDTPSPTETGPPKTPKPSDRPVYRGYSPLEREIIQLARSIGLKSPGTIEDGSGLDAYISGETSDGHLGLITVYTFNDVRPPGEPAGVLTVSGRQIKTFQNNVFGRVASLRCGGRTYEVGTITDDFVPYPGQTPAIRRMLGDLLSQLDCPS